MPSTSKNTTIPAAPSAAIRSIKFYARNSSGNQPNITNHLFCVFDNHLLYIQKFYKIITRWGYAFHCAKNRYYFCFVQ